MSSTSSNETVSTETSRRQPEQRRSRARVEKVLDVAAELIETDGIDALTMSKLADEAGVSLPSIYRYFPSKRSILHTLLQRYTVEMRDSVIQPPKEPISGDNWYQEIRETLLRYWEYINREPAYAAVWSAGFADPEFVHVIVDSVRDTSRTFVERYAGSVELRPDDELTMFMISYLTAATARLAVAVDEETARALIEKLITRAIPALLDVDQRNPPEGESPRPSDDKLFVVDNPADS